MKIPNDSMDSMYLGFDAELEIQILRIIYCLHNVTKEQKKITKKYNG